MKIRRTLTAAAAAAVLAPAAVLAAPAAASATEPVSEAGPRTSAAPGAATPADRSADSATNGGGAGDRTDAGDPDDAGQPCAFESEQLQVAVRGLPRRLAAGGAWAPFSLTLTNTTAKPLGEVQPFLLVSSAQDVDRPSRELDTEYRDAKTGRWKTLHDAEPDDLFGSFAVGPRSSRTLQLRTRVVKGAEPGTGYALAAGDYRNRDGSCGSAKESWYDFTILPAGAKPTQAPAEPGEPGKPGGTAETGRSAVSGGGPSGSDSAGDLGPQGGAQLAATGSSSTLPAIALIGGAAMVAGAGAVIGVRRRKNAAGPGTTDIAA
ncbi:LPXTG cell wall anchor domain-containing protein [Streptomyces sp. NPDC048612]|uniref:LPXTG cell wall anchor domain-containing protein n=1 Tax=Streptomyces sp. NPDC048612 TaxID=3365579 RepID=UPI00371F1DEA